MGSIKYLGEPTALVAHVTEIKEEAAAEVVPAAAEPVVAKKGKGDTDAAAPAADAKAAPKKK